MLDVLVQSRRSKKAALRLLRDDDGVVSSRSVLQAFLQSFTVRNADGSGVVTPF